MPRINRDGGRPRFNKRFRAFDSSTGAPLWETTLGNNANPISHLGKGGNQFVAVNAGGTPTAFALPR